MWLLVQGASAAITLLTLVAAGLQCLQWPRAIAMSDHPSVQPVRGLGSTLLLPVFAQP